MLLFMDGMDCYKDANDAVATGRWQLGGPNSGSVVTNGGRFGGGCLNPPANNNANYWSLLQHLASGTDYFVGISFKNSALPTTAKTLIQVTDISGNVLFSVAVLANGAIQAYNSSSAAVGASAGGVIIGNTWFRIEVKFNTGTSTTTGTIEVRVNGVSVLALTGLNLYRSGAAAEFVQLYGQDSSAHYFDDITVNDTTGDANNDWLGDVRVDVLKPNADTAVADWAPDAGSEGWSRIDDQNGGADEDTSYVQTANVGDKSEFDLSNIVGISSGINAVQVRVRAKKSDAGTRTYRAYLNNNGEVAEGNAINPSTDYSWAFNLTAEANPDGGEAWTDDAVKTLKLGLELVS